MGILYVFLKRKLINHHHCFIKNFQLIIYYNMETTNNYYFLFFKVIEKYLQNTNQFNESFNLKLKTSTDIDQIIIFNYYKQFLFKEKNNYYFLFFKVIEKYLQNTNQFNEVFTLKLKTSTDID